jgi:hypothetical protein
MEGNHYNMQKTKMAVILNWFWDKLSPMGVQVLKKILVT